MISESIKPKKKSYWNYQRISRYDAINKYQNNETDLENVKYVSIDEVPDDSIRLGNVVVCDEFSCQMKYQKKVIC